MIHQCMIKSVVMWPHKYDALFRSRPYSRTVRHTHINKDTTNICSHITTDSIIHW